MGERQFRLGRLDHVHIRVPNRVEALEWYAEHLGFEPVGEFAFWAEGVDGGPVQISADGGATTLAIFEASEWAPMVAQVNGVAFSVDADVFVDFAHSLPGAIDNLEGESLTVEDLIDFDLCWAFEFADPWGNRYELNCYDCEAVRAALLVSDRVVAQRKWPAALYARWRKA